LDAKRKHNDGEEEPEDKMNEDEDSLDGGKPFKYLPLEY
jgi:hypothetical protein